MTAASAASDAAEPPAGTGHAPPPAGALSTGDAAPLSLRGVAVRLGGVAIVEEFDLRLAPGDLVLLTGPNGAGKSTLLRAIAGLLPYSGDIEVGGRYPNSPAARELAVFVPDEPALYEDLTLAEHARFTAILYADPDSDTRCRHWLERFGLGGKLDEFPGTHSRGMRQKLSLSLALGLRPPLLMLDEPFNGLDRDAQENLAAGLFELCAAGGAVLLTGHQLELAGRLEARVVELSARGVGA